MSVRRSKSNNPLAFRQGKCPIIGHIPRFYRKNRVIRSVIMSALAGNRDNGNGTLNNQGSNGNYWSSSVTGTNAFYLNFNSGSVNPANTNNRANGFSVRCVKDLQYYENI